MSLARVASFATVVALSPLTARADAAPPDGTRNAAFSFSVDGVDAFPDRVLLAFPCSGSNGVPVAELVEVRSGQTLPVGRRGGPCTLYAMARADYDAWKTTYQPTHQFKDSAAEALVADPKVTKCVGAPTIVGLVKAGEGRERVHETMRAIRIDGDACTVAGQPSATGLESGSRKGGCAGCAIGDRRDTASAAALVALVALGLGGRWRRAGAGL